MTAEDTTTSGKSLLTIPQAAREYGVSAWQLHAEHKAHRLRCVDLGRGRGKQPSLRVHREEMERWSADLPTAIPR